MAHWAGFPTVHDRDLVKVVRIEMPIAYPTFSREHAREDVRASRIASVTNEVHVDEIMSEFTSIDSPDADDVYTFDRARVVDIAFNVAIAGLSALAAVQPPDPDSEPEYEQSSHSEQPMQSERSIPLYRSSPPRSASAQHSTPVQCSMSTPRSATQPAATAPVGCHCTRCGHSNHSAQSCYAKRNAYGAPVKTPPVPGVKTPVPSDKKSGVKTPVPSDKKSGGKKAPYSRVKPRK